MNEFLFKCFIIANSSTYEYKGVFYDLKNELLPKLATYDGLDIQRIEHECWTCEGTGRYHRYGVDTGRICWSCHGSGIYSTSTHYLGRWILKNEVFHSIHHEPPKFGELSQMRPEIKGRIQHKNYGRKAGLIAFFCLLYEYGIEKFAYIAKRWARCEHRKMTYVFEKFVRRGIELVGQFDVKIGWTPAPSVEDDLPF